MPGMGAGEESFGRPIAARLIGRYELSLRQYDDLARIPLHVHHEPYVTVVLEGGYREQAGPATRNCGAHNIIVHGPDEKHSDHFGNRRTVCMDIRGVPFERSTFFDRPSNFQICDKLRREFRQPDRFSSLVIDSLMLELQVASEREPGENRVPSWLRSVHSRIDDQFHDPLSLTTLARQVDIHPTHLARSFRHHYGLTVGEAVRERRIHFAMKRLATNLPIEMVAMEAGFSDHSHFSRTFLRATGVTPAAFRRSLR
ncbi:MAG: AraC family transcriptional regulator [Acidobacteriota bacterium]